MHRLSLSLLSSCRLQLFISHSSISLLCRRHSKNSNFLLIIVFPASLTSSLASVSSAGLPAAGACAWACTHVELLEAKEKQAFLLPSNYSLRQSLSLFLTLILCCRWCCRSPLTVSATAHHSLHPHLCLASRLAYFLAWEADSMEFQAKSQSRTEKRQTSSVV